MNPTEAIDLHRVVDQITVNTLPAKLGDATREVRRRAEQGEARKARRQRRAQNRVVRALARFASPEVAA